MYDDIYLIKGIFEEVEIANFTSDDIEALGTLLDDKLSQKVMLMINNSKTSKVRTDSNPWAVHLCKQIDLFEKLIGDKVRRYTFHLDIASKGFIESISKLDIETVYEVFKGEEVKQGKSMLEYLFANRKFWISDLDPRRKTDYDRFFSLVMQLERRANVMAHNLSVNGLPVKACNELCKRVSDNKSIFYGQNEKPRKTGVGILLAKETAMKVVLHGFNFRERVQAEGATRIQWRRI